MKILVIGKGFIGERLGIFLSKVPQFEVHTINKSLIDYTNPHTLRMFLGYHRDTLNSPFDRIIIATGVTGSPNVDSCELPENKPLVYFYNVTLPLSIVDIATEFGVKCIHIGSGCIYNGYDMTYKETDTPDFGLFNPNSSFYSKTKHICETVLQDKCHIFRIRMPFTFIPSNKNFLTKIINYPLTLNKLNSLTCVDDFYNFVYNFILLDAEVSLDFGVFNVVNDGPIYTNEIVRLMRNVGIKEAADKKWEFTDNVSDLKTKAERSNCVLSTLKITELGLNLPTTFSSVLKIVNLYKEYSENGFVDISKHENTITSLVEAEQVTNNSNLPEYTSLTPDQIDSLFDNVDQNSKLENNTSDTGNTSVVI